MSAQDALAPAQLPLPGLHDGGIEWVWSEEEGQVDVAEHYEHTTVMLREVASALAPKDGGLYVDCTVGGGGHTEAILLASDTARVIAFDRDPVAIDAAERRLERFEGRFELVHATFGSVKAELAAMGITQVDGICADLGVSSPQLDDAARGMSFRREGPIDMRMDTTEGESALEMIDRMAEDELADVIYRFGDERRSRRIAHSIKRALAAGDLSTTLDLRRAIVRATGPVRVGGVDPATRTFQALRIAVNHELDELTALTAALPALVAPGGVAAILSFHSLEDRIVKHTFAAREIWTPIWKKPLAPSDEEQTMNPRARSAKLRAAVRNGDQ
jgi:16S rRNA (cytosine1402-N4)-methyltransferase